MPQSNDSVVVRTIVYSFGAIIGGWGSFEILLRVDPFAAMSLRYLVFPGLVLAVTALILIALHVVPWPLKTPGGRIKTLLGCLLVGAVVAAIPVLARDGLQWSDWLLVAVGFSIAFSGLIASFIYDHAKLTDTGRAWPAWLEVPMLISAMFLGVMIVFVASGRAKDMTVGDIAQEELRQGGLDFSTSSLQEAMFLISPRSVELFRKAKVDDSDIRDALGRRTPYTDDDPLVKSLLDRVDGDNELRCFPLPLEGTHEHQSCQRIDEFVRLLQPENKPQPGSGQLLSWVAGLPDDFLDMPNLVQPLCFSDIPEPSVTEPLCGNLRAPIRLSVPDGTPHRPLLSHAIAGGHANVAACIVRLCGPPDPTIDLEPAIAQDTPSDLAQHYAYFVLDPHLAIDHGASFADERWGDGEADYLKSILCGDRPLFPLRLNLYWVDAKQKCIDISQAKQNKVRDIINVADILPVGALVRVEDVGCSISPLRSEFYRRIEKSYLNEKLEYFVGNIWIGESEPPLSAVLQRGLTEGIRMFSLSPPGTDGQARLEAHGWGETSSSGVWSLMGRNSSLLMGSPGVGSSSFTPAARKSLREKQDPLRIIADATYKINPLTLDGPSKIRITGTANNDTCFYLAAPEQSQPESLFVRRGEEVSFEAGPFKSETVNLHIAVLSKEDGVSTFQISAQPIDLCQQWNAALGEDIVAAVIDFRQENNSFNWETASEELYRCRIKSPFPAMVEIKMESVIDAVLELHRLGADPELLQAVDGAVTGATGLPAIERLVAFLDKDVEYAIDARAYTGAFNGTPLGVSFELLVDLSPDALLSASRIAEVLNRDTFQNLPFYSGGVSIFRIDEDINDILLSFTSANILSYSNQDGLMEISTDTPVNLKNGAYLLVNSWIDNNWITLSDNGTTNLFAGDTLEEGLQLMPDLSTGVRSHYFVAPRDGYLTITMDGLAADLDLALWGPDEALLSSSVNFETEPDTVNAPVSAGQSYRLDVTAVGASAYTLETRLD